LLVGKEVQIKEVWCNYGGTVESKRDQTRSSKIEDCTIMTKPKVEKIGAISRLIELNL